MISTRDLGRMPDLAGFRRLARSLATLDAIMSPEWEDRFFSFNSSWDDGEMMASMRDGQGDRWFALISSAGTAIVGLAHESETYRPGNPQPWVFDGLPAVFQANLRDEPAFDAANATFCIWRLADDDRWHCGSPEGNADDGSTQLTVFDGDPQHYVDFASDYYEADVTRDDVAAVYRHEPITEELLGRLNQDADLEALEEDLAEIGYPDSSTQDGRHLGR